MRVRGLAVFILPGLIATALAQENAPSSRAELIEEQRRSRASHLTPDVPDKVEQIFRRAQGVIERVFGVESGLRPVIGGMVTGGGFALGPEYYRPDLASGNIVFRTSVRGTVKKYELMDAQVAFPHLARDRAFANLYGVYRNYPSLNYYGPGPASVKTGRTDYRLEDTSFAGAAGVIPVRHLRVGVTGGYLLVNVGPGTDNRFASTDATYSPAAAPGIDRQSNFLRGGPFFEYDYRDNPGDPHSGGNYFASYIFYDDRELRTGNHRKLTAEAQQYLPFFNKKRVIALRAKTELSYRRGNEVVPFYLQPVLGGSDDLRGYRPFRFYDDNMFVMNAEYRWEVMTGFDMAVFGDAGKVFHRHSDFNFDLFQESAGFGLRFKSSSHVVMRWDVGFSREGFQVWIKFNNVF